MKPIALGTENPNQKMVNCLVGTSREWVVVALVIASAGCAGSSNSNSASAGDSTGGTSTTGGTTSTAGTANSGGTGGASVTTPQAFGRLHIVGNQIVDSNGNRASLNGFCLGEVISVDRSGHWNEDLFRNAAAWGAKLLRVPINPATFRMGSDVVFGYLDQAVDWAKKYGLYISIDWHVIGNLPQGIFFYADTSTTLDETVQFWTQTSRRYANETTVAFYDIYNEPAAIEWQGGSWSFADWKSTADQLVTIVQTESPEAIPLVAGLDFAYDLSPGGSQPFASQNIALSVHPYPGNTTVKPRSTGWDKAFGYLSDTYPIMLTEVGFDPCDTIQPDSYKAGVEFGRDILSYANDKGMVWTAFVFFNGTGWPMPLFSDWQNFTPTTSGAFFRDVLLGTPIDQAGNGDAVCP